MTHERYSPDPPSPPPAPPLPASDGGSRAFADDSGRTPAARAPRRGRISIGGLVLILIGAFFLASNLGLLEWLEWSLAWPLILIIIGVAMILRRGGD